MKKNNLAVIFVVLIIIVIVSCIYIFKYSSIDNMILNKKWYHYNSTTGYYDVFHINNNNLSYNKYINLTNDSIYNSCSKYDYDRKNKTIKSNCGLIIKIKSIKEDKLTLIINKEELIFFTSIDQSYNNEFYNKYKISISEFKKEKNNITDLITIDANKIKEIYLNNNELKLIFSGNNCINNDCILALDVYEKWYSLSSNLYYINSSKLNNNILKELNKLDNGFSINIQDYNNEYPVVYIINNKIIDKYKIKCSGLDCSSYYTK